jgi:hypothetical protein
MDSEDQLKAAIAQTEAEGIYNRAVQRNLSVHQEYLDALATEIRIWLADHNVIVSQSDARGYAAWGVKGMLAQLARPILLLTTENPGEDSAQQ